MADILIKVDETVMPEIAKAIMVKTGKTEPLKLPQFAAEIESISGGGSGGGSGSDLPSADGIVFKAASSSITYTYECYEVGSGTTLTGIIQSKAGDWVLATVTTRSTTTFPNDWTLLHEGTSLGSSNADQRMSFLCKYIEEDGEVSIVIQQTSSARIYINLITVSGCGGFVYHDGSEKITTVETASITVDRPPYPTLFWGCSANLWSSGSPNPQWSCKDINSLVIDMGSTTQSRQANFYDIEDGAFRTFTTNVSGGSPCVIDSVEVIIPPEIDKTYYKVDSEWFSKIVVSLGKIVPENGLTIEQMLDGIAGKPNGSSSILKNYPSYVVTQKDNVYYVLFGESSMTIGSSSGTDIFTNVGLVYRCETLLEVQKLIWNKSYYRQLTPVVKQTSGKVDMYAYSDNGRSIYATFSIPSTGTINKNIPCMPEE